VNPARLADIWSSDTRAVSVLLALFLIPNLPALLGGFVYDDYALLVVDERFASLRNLGLVWTSGYWPGQGLALYRPVPSSLWILLRAAGGGSPAVFHLVSLVLGGAVVALFHRLLRRLGLSPKSAFAAAALFALFPIHTEVTATAVGQAELLAAALGLGALLSLMGGHPCRATALFAAGVLSKESVAVLPLAALVLPEVRREPLRRLLPAAGGAAIVVAGILLMHRLVSVGGGSVNFLDNPLAKTAPGPRILTALWVQVLYLAKTLAPATLSADYSWAQIEVVSDLTDPRAWAGLALLAGGALGAYRLPMIRTGLALWAVFFLPTANVLYPIGTIMGERLAYAPSLGLALALGVALVRLPRWQVVLAGLFLVYGARTWVRNLDWRSADSFYPAMLAAAPRSAKAHANHASWLASRGRDAEAVAGYDRSIAIFPGNPEAWHNRGNALVRLGRLGEARQSYAAVLRMMPGSAETRALLQALDSGAPIRPSPQRY
jgi:hypothetical protein